MTVSACWGRFWILCCVVVAVSAWPTVTAQPGVTLQPAANPTSGQPGVHNITVTGSNFPSGTIPPANVTVTLAPATAGAGPTASTPATAVQTITGTTRRVSFQIPSSIQVAAATAYRVSIAGTTSTGIGFASGSPAGLTVNPPPSLTSVTPDSANQGQTVTVALTSTFTNFVQGATQANFGADISVGGGPPGGFGPVTVTSATSGTAQVVIGPSAVPGMRTVTVRTGVQQASRDNGFIVVQPNQAPTASAGGPYSARVMDVVAFNASGSSDPDGDALQYAWTFGDGGKGSGVAPTHTYTTADTFTATVTVSDGRGGTQSASAQVTVRANQAPAASAGGPYTARVGDAVSFDASGSTDPDGDPLQHAWTFGDGGTGEAVKPTHTYTTAGTFTATVTVSDGRGGTNSASAQVTVTAAPPAVLTVAIAEPTAGLTVRTSSITVRGTVSTPNARVLVQNVLASVTGQTFEAQGVTLVEGANQLLVRARNDLGQEATATRAIALDTIPPALEVSSPPEREVLTTQTTAIMGRVSDASSVTCALAGAPAPITNGVFTAAAALTPGSNVFTVTCQDAAGNASSRSRTLYFSETRLSINDLGPFNGATGVAPTSPIVVTFSEAVDPATVSSTTVFLSAAGAVLPATISVSPDGLVATLTPLSPLPAGTLINVVITAGIESADGTPLPSSFASQFTTSGTAVAPGVLVGEAYDDSRGLPLQGATAQAIDPVSGQVLATAQTDERGRYLLSPGRASVLVRVTKAGFASVLRGDGAPQGAFANVFDARLTPLASARTVNALFGSALQSATGDVLAIPPGGLASDAEITFTPISEQAPRLLFPQGWSPLSVVDIVSPGAFLTPVSLGLVDRSGVAGGRLGVVARFDDASSRWIALRDVTLPATGALQVEDLASAGQYALLVPDTGDGAPPAVVAGQPLGAGAAVAIPPGSTGAGTVTPTAGRADDPTPAAAIVTVTSESPLRSGTPLRGDFMELFVLRDGQPVAPLDTSQDLVGYRVQSDVNGRSLASHFPIAPSRTFGASELSEGTITVSMFRSVSATTGLIGNSGGGVQSSDGSRVIAPAGAFAGDVPVHLRRVDTSALRLVTPAETPLLGILDLDLSGQTSTAPLVLSLGGGAALAPTGSQVVVAELRNVRGRERLVFVTLARVDGDALTTMTTIGAVTVAGVRTGGRYAFLRFDGSLAIVTGMARDTAGRRDGHVTELEAFPFISVTGATGAFVLASPTGPFSLVATAAATSDRVRVQGTTGTALPEIVIGISPPRVESIVVRAPRLEGNFAGPVVLLGKPAPIVDDDTTGQSNGNGNGQVNAGERIELALSVRNDGTVPINGGSVSVAIRGPAGLIPVLPASIPVSALAPDVPTAVGPFVFDAPVGVNPALLRYTLTFATGAGVSRVIPFNLPLGVDHWSVSAASEITVRFSEPVSAAAGAITLEREDGAALLPVESRVFEDEGGDIVVLRPLAPLAQDAVYRITLTGGVVDSDGRALAGAPISERLRTEDRTPPATIGAGNISASVPDSDGFVTITATAGSVNPDDVVILLNETTGFTVLVAVAADGSFTGRVRAELTNQIVVLLRDRNGNETRVDPGPLLRRDPVTGVVLSAVIGRSGGTVTSAEGIRLIVPAGSLSAATELSVSRVHEPFALPADLAAVAAVVAAFQARFAVVDRVRIDAGGGQFRSPVRLALLAPPGAVPGDLYVLIGSRTVKTGGPLADLDNMTGLTAAQSPVRTVDRLVILDSATVKSEGGQLTISTDSPPFSGITEADVLTLLRVTAPLVFLAGEVRRDSTTGPLVPGVVVRSLPAADATAPFAAITDGQGRFVVADAALSGTFNTGDTVEGRLDVDDPAFTRVIRRDVRGVIGQPAPPSTVIAQLVEPFVLPTALPPEIVRLMGDLEPPEVEILIEGPSVRSLDDALSSAVGSPLNVTVHGRDNDQVTFVGLEMDQGFGLEPAALRPDGTVVITPTRSGLLTLRAQARDRSGNITVVLEDILIIVGGGGGDGDEPVITGVIPGSAPQGQVDLPVTINGRFTHFVQGTTAVSFGSGITVLGLSVEDAARLTANVSVACDAPLGPRLLTVTTGSETVRRANGFTVTEAIRTIVVNPNSGQQNEALIVEIAGRCTHFVQGVTTVDFGAGITVTSVNVVSGTRLTASISIAATATPGPRSIIVRTGTEQPLPGSFTVTNGPVITRVTPDTAEQGQTLSVEIDGRFTHFVQGTTQAIFGPNIAVNSQTVLSATTMTANISIACDAAPGARDMTARTGTEDPLPHRFTVTSRPIWVNPDRGEQGQELDVVIMGHCTNFVQGITTVSFGPGVTVANIVVATATRLTASISIADNAAFGTRDVTVTTGAEAPKPGAFTIVPAVQHALLSFRCDAFDAPIHGVFSAPLDPSTVNASTIQVADAQGLPVASSLTVSSDGVFGLVSISPSRYLRLGAKYRVDFSASIKGLDGRPVRPATRDCTVPAPRLVDQVQLQNTEDVALLGNAVLAVNHPNGSSPGDNGRLYVFQHRIGHGGELQGLEETTSTPVIGRPLSLAVDRTRAFVGNRFLGSIATQEPLIFPFVPAAGEAPAGTVLGCGLEMLLVPLLLNPLPTVCTQLLSIWRDLPHPPSNVEVFDLSDLRNPTHLGGAAANSIAPEIWNPNTWPNRVEVTPQGIGVQSFLDNLEFFSPTARPGSLGVVGQIKRYGEVTPRGNDGRLGTADDLDNEFVDAAFFDGFAVTLARDGVRLVSTRGIGDRLQQERAPQLALLPMAAAFGGRIGGVSRFEWVDTLARPQTSDLAFIATTDNRLTIFDVTNPSLPVERGTLPNTFGNMSFDPCRGIAYVHGREGEFHVVDFNDPLHPLELNRPDSGQDFTVQAGFTRRMLGRHASFNGNANRDGMVYLANAVGVAAVRVDVSATSRFEYRQACRFKFLDSHGNELDANTDALAVSKFVTNQDFNATDPDNFKVQIVDSAVVGNTVSVDLTSRKATGSPHHALNGITLTRVAGTNKFRSGFLRLVADAVDQGEEPTRTLLVETGGRVEATYAGAPGVTAAMDVCKPSTIKTVTVSMFILRDWSTIDPDAEERDKTAIAAVRGDVARMNERYAQICMQVMASVEVVDPPPDVDLTNGFKRHTTVPNSPTPEETALVNSSLATANTDDIQIFWVNFLDPSAAGIAYVPQYWTGLDARFANNAIVVAGRKPFTLAHELGHLLCDAAPLCGGGNTEPGIHHPTHTNLMYFDTSDSNEANDISKATKRIDTTQQATMRSHPLAR